MKINHIEFDEAVDIARRHLQRLEDGSENVELDLVHTIEKDYGWAFIYNSSVFVRTRDPRYILVGAAPFLVLREDGDVVQFDSSLPIEMYLEEYERVHGLR